MKGVFTCLWIYFHIIDCCFVQEHGDVNHAFLSCRTNVSCEAQCYRGYVFPSGETKTVYSCQQDLSGMVPTCIRIPTVIVKYMAAWEFHNIPANECENISLLLNHSESVLKEVVGLCNTMAIDVNITFTYQTHTFTMYTIFTGTYYNFTSTSVLESCVALHLDYIRNQTSPLIRSILDDISYMNETLNYTLRIDWQISDRQEHCPAGTEVKNVNVSLSNKYNIEYYCETISLSTDFSTTTGFQNFSNVTTTLAVNDNTPANYTAIYIAAPILGIAYFILFMATLICYKIKYV
ncbi:uncharacterized protein LOC111100918 [Crassostrea virginica]